MKLGFMTNSFAWVGVTDLTSIASWASENNFEDLEVGPNIPLDQTVFENVINSSKINISSFVYCRNFLSDNKEETQFHINELVKRIEFAPKVGINKIICSTGVNSRSFLENNHIKYDPESCIDEAVELFKRMTDLATKNNVKLCFENCPVVGNIAISPYLWDKIFDKIDSPNLGLAFDPSHFVWQFMNPYTAIQKFGDKIFHVHGKDCEVLYDKLSEIGILHGFSARNGTIGVGENAIEKMWWRYRLVGNGDLNWSKIIANLQEAGYDGTISIEHEDPVWGGSLEKVQHGILKSQKHLKQFI